MAKSHRSVRPGGSLWIVAILVILVGVAVYHFRGPSPSSSPPTAKTHQGTHNTPGTPRLAANLDPLTGLPEPDHGPLIAVMVENSEYARPQAGLTSADVVYEAYTENFYYSRFMLLFYGHAPTNVGPVRSARPYFVTWVDEWHAAYARAGGSALADQDIAAWGIHDMDWITVDQALYHEVTTRPAPHDVYTSVPLLMQYAKQHWGNPPVAPHWPFETHVTRGTPPYQTLTFVWNTQNTIERWVWDQSAQKWARYIQCNSGCPTTAWTPVTDANNNQQVEASNVIFQYTHEVLDTADPNKADLWVLISTIGSGKAVMFLGHHYYVGTWKKASLTAPTQFYMANGQLAPFQPGQTWIEVVPTSPNQSSFSLTLSRS